MPRRFGQSKMKKIIIPLRQLTQYVNGNTPFTDADDWKRIALSDIIKTEYKK